MSDLVLPLQTRFRPTLRWVCVAIALASCAADSATEFASDDAMQHATLECASKAKQGENTVPYFQQNGDDPIQDAFLLDITATHEINASASSLRIVLSEKHPNYRILSASVQPVDCDGAITDQAHTYIPAEQQQQWEYQGWEGANRNRMIAILVQMTVEKMDAETASGDTNEVSTSYSFAQTVVLPVVPLRFTSVTLFEQDFFVDLNWEGGPLNPDEELAVVLGTDQKMFATEQNPQTLMEIDPKIVHVKNEGHYLSSSVITVPVEGQEDPLLVVARYVSIRSNYTSFVAPNFIVRLQTEDAHYF